MMEYDLYIKLLAKARVKIANGQGRWICNEVKSAYWDEYMPRIALKLSIGPEVIEPVLDRIFTEIDGQGTVENYLNKTEGLKQYTDANIARALEFRLQLIDKLTKEYKWKQPMQLSKRFKALLATLRSKLSSTLKLAIPNSQRI